MNKWKIYAILLTLVSLNMAGEIVHIALEDELKGHRLDVLLIGIPILLVTVYFTFRLWKKANAEKRFF